jgi:hypothetical protein
MNLKLIILNYQIELHRLRLNELVNTRELTDKKVIAYSSKLDELINEYFNASLGIKKAA